MADTRELVAYVNGRLLPYGQAMVELGEGGPQPAAGLYDAERTFKGRPFKLRAHLERLYRSLEAANMGPGISLDEMEAATLRVLEANQPFLEPGDDFILSQVSSARPASASDGNSGVDVLIYCQFIDFQAFADGYLRGVRLITPDTYSVPVAPPSSGADGPVQETLSLMTDDKGSVTECRHANFMLARDGRIKLPDRRKVLPGISMETVLELAGTLGIPVDEGAYPAQDVYEADEAFISGTRYCMLPVATLNGLTLGDELPGPVTSRLLAAWSDMVGLDFVQQATNHNPGDD